MRQKKIVWKNLLLKCVDLRFFTVPNFNFNTDVNSLGNMSTKCNKTVKWKSEMICTYFTYFIMQLIQNKEGTTLYVSRFAVAVTALSKTKCCRSWKWRVLNCTTARDSFLTYQQRTS